MLWLGCRLAAAAPIRPLAWELSCAADGAIKRKKKKRCKGKKPSVSILILICINAKESAESIQEQRGIIKALARYGDCA